MDWLHSRQQTCSRKLGRISDYCVPLRGDPAIVDTRSLQLLLVHLMELSYGTIEGTKK